MPPKNKPSPKNKLTPEQICDEVLSNPNKYIGHIGIARNKIAQHFDTLGVGSVYEAYKEIPSHPREARYPDVLAWAMVDLLFAQDVPKTKYREHFLNFCSMIESSNRAPDVEKLRIGLREFRVAAFHAYTLMELVMSTAGHDALLVVPLPGTSHLIVHKRNAATDKGVAAYTVRSDDLAIMELELVKTKFKHIVISVPGGPDCSLYVKPTFEENVRKNVKNTTILTKHMLDRVIAARKTRRLLPDLFFALPIGQQFTDEVEAMTELLCQLVQKVDFIVALRAESTRNNGARSTQKLFTTAKAVRYNRNLASKQRKEIESAYFGSDRSHLELRHLDNSLSTKAFSSGKTQIFKRNECGEIMHDVRELTAVATRGIEPIATPKNPTQRAPELDGILYVGSFTKSAFSSDDVRIIEHFAPAFISRIGEYISENYSNQDPDIYQENARLIDFLKTLTDRAHVLAAIADVCRFREYTNGSERKTASIARQLIDRELRNAVGHAFEIDDSILREHTFWVDVDQIALVLDMKRTLPPTTREDIYRRFVKAQRKLRKRVVDGAGRNIGILACNIGAVFFRRLTISPGEAINLAGEQLASAKKRKNQLGQVEVAMYEGLTREEEERLETIIIETA